MYFYVRNRLALEVIWR